MIPQFRGFGTKAGFTSGKMGYLAKSGFRRELSGELAKSVRIQSVNRVFALTLTVKVRSIRSPYSGVLICLEGDDLQQQRDYLRKFVFQALWKQPKDHYHKPGRQESKPLRRFAVDQAARTRAEQSTIGTTFG